MKKFLGIFLSVSLLLQGTLPALALDKPAKTFYEKAGWLDYKSNTLRRVAQRGESGAYNTYKNNNPSPRNQYERVNIHQANLDYLSLYQNSALYRRAAAIRDAFLAEETDEEQNAGPETLTPQDLQPVYQAVDELTQMLRAEGERYPIITQAALQVSAALLPLNTKYHFFKPDQLALFKNLQKRILAQDTQCSQGSGYRLFCEGRVDALYGLAVTATAGQDAQLISKALLQDLQEPIAAAMLPVGFETLQSVGRADLIEPVLAKAVEEEGDTIWQKIDILSIGYWVDKIQFARGRYLGNVTAGGRLPLAHKGKADGNIWEELAYVLANGGNPSPAGKRLLEIYGLGACRTEQVCRGEDCRIYDVRLTCPTLTPFLVGALNAGFTQVAQSDVRSEAARMKLSPAAYVARMYFEKTFGDVDAESEYRLDGLLHRVFSAELKKAEQARQQALAQNAAIDGQIKSLQEQLRPYMQGQKSWFETQQGDYLPESLHISNQIAALERQKTPVPARPDAALKMYDRQSSTYRSKERGQAVYETTRNIAANVDIAIGIYFTVAIPVGVTRWGMSLARGVRAVRAGKITADARKLARLSMRLRKINMQNLLRSRKAGAQNLAAQLRSTAVKNAPVKAKASSAVGKPKAVARPKPVNKPAAPKAAYTPQRSTQTGLFPSGLQRDEELLRQWKESYLKGHFTPRDQVEAVAGMKPAQMNNIIEYIYYMDMPKAEKLLMKPVLTKGRLPRFMYEDRLLPRTRRLPAGYYKNRFNEKVDRLVELAKKDQSVYVHQAELDNILTSMKDYTFTQGFGYANDAEMTRGLLANWKELTSEILTPGKTPDRLRMNALWQKPVQHISGKSVSLQDYFSQKVKTAFFEEKSPDFFINSPKWVALENERRNLAAADYIKRLGKPEVQPWYERLQDRLVLGKRSDYLTLDQFGKIMADQYRRNPHVAKALTEAESAPSSLTFTFNCYEGRACQAAITDGGASYIPKNYDGTRQMLRFEAHTQDNVRVVVFENGRWPKPRVVDLKTVAYVKDLHPSSTDLVRAGKMISDRLDDTWDLITIQQAGKTLVKIPDLKATIYPHMRVVNQPLPPQLTGGGVNAYLTLFTKDFYPVKTVYRLRFKNFKPVLEPEYFIRKEVPALSGSIHRERLTFLDQVADWIKP